MESVSKQTKPFYKKWWGILIIVLGVIFVISIFLPNQEFKNGIKAYESKDYISAYEHFLKVPEKDENYKSAQDKIKELKPIYDSLKQAEIANIENKALLASQKEANDKRIADSIKQAEIESITFSADQISLDYSKNKIKADSKYKDKEIYITGIIEDFGTDILNDSYLTFQSDKFLSFKCNFKDKNELLKLAKGDNIKIFGKCEGEIANILTISDCKIAQ